MIQNYILTILNPSLEVLGVIDDYISLNWPERYNDYTEITIELPKVYSTNQALRVNNIITVPFSKRIMIIRNISLDYTEDLGPILKVTGYSGEYILQMRTSDLDMYYEDINLHEIFTDLIYANYGLGASPSREISTFMYKVDPGVLDAITVTDKIEPSSVYDIFKRLCDSNLLGFKVELDDSPSGRFLVLSVYSGENRSYSQDSNPYVIFSDNYDNIVSYNYYLELREKNVALVISLDDVPELRKVYVYEADSPEPTGWDRYEGIVDATSLSRKVDDSPDLTDAEFLGVLTARGRDFIKDNTTNAVFDGELDVESQFVYGEHFYLGDIVQCVFDGKNKEARAVEVVFGVNNEGISTYVSFDFEEQEENI